MNSNKLFRIEDFITPGVPLAPCNSSICVPCPCVPPRGQEGALALTNLRFVTPSVHGHAKRGKGALTNRRFVCKAVQNQLYLLRASGLTKQDRPWPYFVRSYMCTNVHRCHTILPNIFWYSTYKTSYTVVRPLLNCLRCNITMSCISSCLPVYPDLSNLKMRYSRNRIRKQILPTIKLFLNPKVEKAVFQFSEFYNKSPGFSRIYA